MATLTKEIANLDRLALTEKLRLMKLQLKWVDDIRKYDEIVDRRGLKEANTETISDLYRYNKNMQAIKREEQRELKFILKFRRGIKPLKP